MTIYLDKDYFARPDSDLLGYVGEHQSRKVALCGYETEGADSYRLRIEYSDEVSYEIDITQGECIIDGSVLRSPQKVKAQLYALRAVNDSYELVKKSQVFLLAIKPSLSGEPAPIPTYEQAQSLLDEILEYIAIYGSYNALTDKPRINNTELVGNKTLGDIGIINITSAELAAMW